MEMTKEKCLKKKKKKNIQCEEIASSSEISLDLEKVTEPVEEVEKSVNVEKLVENVALVELPNSIETSAKNVEPTQKISANVFEATNLIENSIEKNEYTVIFNPVKDIENLVGKVKKPASTIQNMKEPIEKPIKPDEKIVEMKAYTESQLMSFYYNAELESLDNFTSDFINAEMNGTAFNHHPFHLLISNYSTLLQNFCTTSTEIYCIREEIKELEQHLWGWENATITGSGSCRDGNHVKVTHNYERSFLRVSALSDIATSLEKLKTIMYERYVTDLFRSEEAKLQINSFLDTVIANCVNDTNLLPLDLTVISLRTLENDSKQWFHSLADLRMCISILFRWHRRPLLNLNLTKEIQMWLEETVAILLRLATWQDHLFLLGHVMRCPAGVGTWAAAFIQTPIFPSNCPCFADPQINHLLTVLSFILSPIRARKRFLEAFAHDSDEEQWVVVDSSEEDEENEDDENEEVGVKGIRPLKENDLVAILKQLPMEEMFRKVLMVGRKDFKDTFDASSLTEHHLLKYSAFSTTLLKILRRGLETYDRPRYKQFSKRLMQMVVRVTQHYTDHWEQFLMVQKIEDAAMLQRLHVEYDSFFLRAIRTLYRPAARGNWQFLSTLPYRLVSIKSLRLIYQFLRGKYHVIEGGENYFEREWEENEGCFVLNTLANMALARMDNAWHGEEEEVMFIKFIVMDLLKIGFISETTRDTCHNESRILLAQITSKRPSLLSDVLTRVRDEMKTIESHSLYLYEELPLAAWKITNDDFEIVASLLSHPFSSFENKLSRMIFSRLNWCEMAYEIQRKVAIVLVGAVRKEPQLENWAWQTAMRLRLHVSDGGCKLSQVENVDQFEVLVDGLHENHPLTIFISFLVTTLGHSPSLLISKSLSLLSFLLPRHPHPLQHLLYLIVPLFIPPEDIRALPTVPYENALASFVEPSAPFDDACVATEDTFISPEALGGSNDFRRVIMGLGGEMKGFEAMLEAQRGVSGLVRTWCRVLTAVEGWRLTEGVLVMLNAVVKCAFAWADDEGVVRNEVFVIFRDLFKCTTPLETPSGPLSSILNWVSNVPASGTFIPNTLSNMPWLAFVVISVEHEVREERSGLWRELLRQLRIQKGKVNVDQILKQTCTILSVPLITSSSLSIYRFAYQILLAPSDHPLLPLLLLKFFSLYLPHLRCCGGEKFFDGLRNFSTLKKLKCHIRTACQFFDIIKEGHKEIRERLRKVFEAFFLWLEEPIFMERDLELNCLPARYEVGLLDRIFSGEDTLWVELLDRHLLNIDSDNNLRYWQTHHFRFPLSCNKPSPSSSYSDPFSRISRHLIPHNTPMPPPTSNRLKLLNDAEEQRPGTSAGFLSFKGSFETTGDGETFADVRRNLKDFERNIELYQDLTMRRAFVFPTHLEKSLTTLKEAARTHVSAKKEVHHLDAAYVELVPQLYHSRIKRVIKKMQCAGAKGMECSGAAEIVLEVPETNMNQKVNKMMQSNRSNYESYFLQIERGNSTKELCYMASILRNTITMLQSQKKSRLGVELFYRIWSMLDVEFDSYPLGKYLLSMYIELLGQTHISGVESEIIQLLDKILENSSSGEHHCSLASYFDPRDVSTEKLLLMYSKICTKISRNYYDVILAVLSKFKIDYWLNKKIPKIRERTQLINILMEALTTLNYDPPKEASLLHSLLQQHLMTIFKYQFPEHYGEVLVQFLKCSCETPEGVISPSVWMNVLNFLANPVHLTLDAPLGDQMSMYAQHDHVLQYQDLLDTADLLANHFTRLRLTHGLLYGVYQKMRRYVQVFSIFSAMVGHSVVVGTLNAHQGLLGDKSWSIMWPRLRDMYAPWLVPFSATEEITIISPWTPADTSCAQKMLESFRACLGFVLHTLPASNAILCTVWQWYVFNYGHKAVKHHVLTAVHQTLSTLPWQDFYPTINDIELMLKVSDQYLPEHHNFLCHVFFMIPWSIWFNNRFPPSHPHAPPSRVLHCFLGLLIKLSLESTRRGNHDVTLLEKCEQFNWKHLEEDSFQGVCDWLIVSTEAGRILWENEKEKEHLEKKIFRFLKNVSTYNQRRKFIFMRAHLKLLATFSHRHKNDISRYQTQIKPLLTHYLNEINHSRSNADHAVANNIYLTQFDRSATNLETIVTNSSHFASNSVSNQPELNPHGSVAISSHSRTNTNYLITAMRELLDILNVKELTKIGTETLVEYLEKSSGEDFEILYILLTVVGEVVNDSIAMVEILEAVIQCYFVNKDIRKDSDDCRLSWLDIATILTLLPSKDKELRQATVNNSRLLTLNAIIWRMMATKQTDDDFDLLLDWMEKIKINSSTEPKIIVLWMTFLFFTERRKESATSEAARRRFVSLLTSIADGAASSSTVAEWSRGLLSAIGVVERSEHRASVEFGFLCRAVAGYVSTRLPSAAEKNQQGDVDSSKLLLSLNFGQTQGKIKECADSAIIQIQDPNNSIRDARKFVLSFAKHFYSKPYLIDISS